MRKFSAACFLFAFASVLTAAHAQPRVGIKLGGNYSTPAPASPMPQQGSIYGYNITASTNYYLYDFLYVESDLSLSQKGYTFMDQLGYNTRVSITYLEIPLLLKGVYSTGRQSDFEFFLGLGPSVGYAMFGRESTDDFYSFHEIVFTKKWNRSEFGGAASLGMNYSLGPGFLVIEARYFYGLTPVEKSGYKPKNTVIGLALGYSYFKGRRGIKHRRF